MSAADKPVTCVRLELPVKQALKRAARDDQRSLSGLIAKILADWVQARTPTLKQPRATL